MDFNDWFDSFVNQYSAFNPVNASFLGLHQWDSHLPNVSNDSVQQRQRGIEQLLLQADEISTESLTPIQRLDLRAAAAFLRTQLWECQTGHVILRNPSYYTGEGIFGVLSPLLSDYAPLNDRLNASIARMKDIPAFLLQAQSMLRDMPTAWVSRARNECDGAAKLFSDGLKQFAKANNIDSSELVESANLARNAFGNFASWLDEQLVNGSANQVTAGADSFDLLLKEAHFAPQSSSELLCYAYKELVIADKKLQSGFKEFSVESPQAALAQLSNIYPEADDYYASYSRLWEECRASAISNDLVTWPDFPIEYVPRPYWVDDASKQLYFLFYRAPAAFNRPPVHNYFVNPLPQNRREEFLQANNLSVIKLNHVVHHGAIGHHVQNWNAYHSQSRMGQISAVDTASRVAMMTGLTMAEGWACYATYLMEEFGFLTPLESYSEHQSRRRMCARAIVDIELHTGNFTFEEAVAFYMTRAGMPENAARSEVTKNSMYPAGAVIYLLGQDAIHTLRQDIQELDGANFSLKNFHDEFLSYGSLPVYLIAEEMKRKRNETQ